MEYRNDLADVLLSGLPDDERDHVVHVIHQLDAEKLRRKRASGDSADAVEAPDPDDSDIDSELDDYAGSTSSLP